MVAKVTGESFAKDLFLALTRKPEDMIVRVAWNTLRDAVQEGTHIPSSEGKHASKTDSLYFTLLDGSEVVVHIRKFPP